MSTPLNVLIVEDSEDDMLLVLRELKRGGYLPVFERVETREAMSEALGRKTWDVIISDYRMPHFSAPEALKLAKELTPDIPFIVVSGTIGEDVAVGAMKSGANDYMMKHNLLRLVPAVRREIEQAQVRRERRLAEERLNAFMDSATDCFVLLDASLNYIDLNKAALARLGKKKEELIGKSILDARPEIKESGRYKVYLEVMKTGKPLITEDTVFDYSQSRDVPMDVRAFKVGDGIGIICTDITERKRMETEIRESERRYRLLAENVTDVIWTNDIHAPNRLTYISPSVKQLLGFSVEEAMARGMAEVFTPASFETAMKVYTEEMAREGQCLIDLFRSRTLEVELYHKNGSTVPVELKYSLIRGVDGLPTQILAIARDIAERQQAEKQLRESQERLRGFMDSSTEGFILFDSKLNYLDINKTALARYSLSKDQVIGRNLLDIRQGAKESVRYRKYLEVLSTGRPMTLEDNVPDRSKSRHVPMEVRIFKVGDGLGVIGTDISERKQAEKKLRESEERFRSFADAAPDGFVFFDAELNYIDINPTALARAGKKKEEVVGKNLLEVRPEVKETVRYKKYLEVMKTGKPVVIEEAVVNYPKSGTVILQMRIFKVGDGLGVISSDVTERKKMEDALTHAAEEWQATFDSITDRMSIHDKHFKILRVNKAFADVLKMKPEELIGKNCYEVIHGTKEPILDCPHKRTIETKLPVTIEFFEPRLGLYLEITTAPIFDDQGEVVASVHIVRDVTERKKMEERLLTTDRLASIGELASGVAHEVNNPLTSILGFSQLLLERNVPDDIKEDLKIISTEAERASKVVKNLLTFARKHSSEKQSVNLNEIIEKVLALRAYEQRVSNISVITQFAPDLPQVVADFFQLQQVFFNLIINAEYFMAQAHGKGTLNITTERTGNIAKVVFVDDGPGINRENLKHLFNPFFTTKPVGKGTGLGLSICHGIVTEHGGRIYAASELGKGATFTIELPVIDQ